MARYKDISGLKKGRITVLHRLDGHDSRRSALWRCRCDCGKEFDISYNNLIYSKVISCGCRRKEHGKELVHTRPLIDGTAVDVLNRPAPISNTSGCKGIYIYRGKYMAQIKFRKKAYYLGLYSNLTEALEVRKKAEDLLFGSTTEYFERWNKKAMADPQWARENPVKIHVTREEGQEISISFSPVLD